MYQKFGLFDDYWKYTESKEIDEGRMMVTKNEADKYLFKVPSLRNIEKTWPYFHDGSVEKLDDAVKIMAKVELNKDLSDKETKEIVTFLASLTGNVPAIAK
jgi:cytochrome c peroxidase